MITVGTTFTLTVGKGEKAVVTKFNEVHEAFAAFQAAVDFKNPVYAMLFNDELRRAIYLFKGKIG